MRWPIIGGIAAVVAAAGLGAGFLGGSFLGSSDTPASTVENVSVFDCPAGTQVADYEAGYRVYAVARSEGGDWTKIRDLDNPGRSVWIQTGAIELDDEIELPTSSCESSEFVIASNLSTTTTTTVEGSSTTLGPTTTTTVDDETTTTRQGATTTSAGQNTTTTTVADTTTTQPLDTTPPVISNAFVSPGQIWELDGGGISCGSNPRVAEVSAFVTDDVGVDSVTASWNVGGSNTTSSMSGTAGTYTTDFGPFDYQTISNTAPYFVNVTITIEAEDEAGNQASAQVTGRLWSTAECFG